MTSAALRIDDAVSDAEFWADLLLQDGYCIIPKAVCATKVAALQADLADRFDKTPFCEGGFYGPRTKRFGGLLKRSEHAEQFGIHALILEVVDRELSR